jgi:hypothetical protein
MRLGMSMRMGEAIRRIGGVSLPFGGHPTLTDGLVELFPLSEDIASGNRTGVNGMVLSDLASNVYAEDGLIGKAAALDYPGDFSLTNVAGIDLDPYAGEYSINVWFKSKNDASGRAQYVVVLHSAYVYLAVYSGLDNTNHYGSFSVFDGTSWNTSASGWHTRAVGWHMYTGVQTGGSMYVYIDGTGYAGVPTGAPSNPGNKRLSIGNERYAGGSGIDGWVQQAGVWSRGLEVAEITDLYASGAGLFY